MRSERSGRAKLVDFRQPERNDFLALNQVTIVNGTKNRRPDILLYGLPLGQIELKNPAAKEADEAVQKLADANPAVPQFQYDLAIRHGTSTSSFIVASFCIFFFAMCFRRAATCF